MTADGAVFAGEAAGAVVPVATGELVFNTAMSGYQEVITDPSYAGQVIAFTSTHIGNYGTNAADDEAAAAALPRGRGVRPGRPSRPTGAPPRASSRSCAATACPPSPASTPGAWPATSARPARCPARSAPRPRRSCAPPPQPPSAPTAWTSCRGSRRPNPASTPAPAAGAASGLRIVAYDFGVKATMVRLLTTLGTVTVVPAGTTADEVLALDPDGVFLSNGPGDPAALPGPTAAVADLVGRVPIFGICLGHQILATALGRHDLQAALRAPRRQPPRAAPRDRRGGDHQPEPQLRRRRRLRPRRRDDARQPQRRRDRGPALPHGAGVLGAVPPRGRARARTTPATSSAPSST